MSQPVIDARNGGAQSAGATSLSWSHTLGAGLSNTLLMVGADHAAGPITSISGINWDDAGTPQALASKGTAAETQGFGKTELWFVKAPVAGTKTIKVTYAASCECGAGSTSWSNVDQTTPFNAASPQTATGTGAGAQPSVAATSSADEWVVDAVMAVLGPAGYDFTLGGGQTSDYTHNRGANTSTGAGSDETGAASVTMSWSGTQAGDTWAQVAVSIRGAASIPSPQLASPWMRGFKRFMKPRVVQHDNPIVTQVTTVVRRTLNPFGNHSGGRQGGQ